MNFNSTVLFSSLLFSGTCLFAADGAASPYPGYRLIEKRFIREINAECLYLEHLKSGARILKIAAPDPNRTFAVAFRTLPESDAGTPHILEHSVLCGSRRYPVKSPFLTLAKGSLSTFLNAMTGDDYTVYPVASMNEKAYFNLMSVYLDAVFHPLIYDRPDIFRQEGWHYELNRADDPLTRSGVVYNEMKGCYSQPLRRLFVETMRSLFPDNAYRFDSGGDPQAIPTLTREQFLDFHRRHYHPSNAFIVLYGDTDLDKELKFLDSFSLAEFSRRDLKFEAKPQSPFPRPKEETLTYAVAEDQSAAGQSYLSWSWVVGSGKDRKLQLDLEILAEVLFRHESAPVRLALRRRGIGQDCQAYVTGNELQSVLMLVVPNANPDQAQAFRETVTAALRDGVKTGLDRQLIEAVLNREEFRLRENNDAQKGLKYCFNLLPRWMTYGNPFEGLEYEDVLARTRQGLAAGDLEKIVSERLLANPHALLLTMNPEPGLEQRENEARATELAAVKKQMPPQEITALVKETAELAAEQQRPDSPQALATIPTLTRRDLNRKATWYPFTAATRSGVPFLHHDTFTAGVFYFRLYFDLQVLPPELIPYAALLRELLGKLDTANYSYGELDTVLNRDTGGFSAATNFYVEKRDAARLVPRFIVAVKALSGKADAALGLTDEIVLRSRFDRPERLKELLSRLQSRLESQLKSDGMGYACKRLGSYLSRRGLLEEMTSGLDYYRFISGLNTDFDAQAPEIAANLKRTAELLFRRPALTAAVTCSPEELKTVGPAADRLFAALPSETVPKQTWTLRPSVRNEALMAASKVQYVIQGGNFKKAGFAWTGGMLPLSQVVALGWLWEQVRMVGGAYGAHCWLSPDGNLLLASYRDPNLEKTLAAYDAIPDYLAKLRLNDKELTRYLIGAISHLDQPLSPSATGDLAFRRYFERTTPELLQRDRDELFAADTQTFRDAAALFRAVLAQHIICVYGNEGKLEQSRKLFKKLVPLQQK